MTKHPSRESGITLVELLATLAILSILVVLSYGLFFNGLSASQQGKEQVNIQQEMNLLMTTITKIHETEDTYSIVVDQYPNAHTVQIKGGTKSFEFSNSNFEYKLDYYQQVGTLLPNTIQTKDPIYITVVISNKDMPSQKYEVKTIISRL
jgi:prepilin-type N-terminal cleavage/methylation domain-containing protein